MAGTPYEEWSEEMLFGMEATFGSDRSRWGGADLFRTRDGVEWEAITLDGFGDRDSYGVRNMLATQWGLMVGMANPIDGFEVWLLPSDG
jgi:hypothetical protein